MISFPFNFNPFLGDEKTGAHTVPTGYYALVFPLGPFFELNGTRFGFAEASYDFATGGGSGPFISSLFVNNSRQTLYVEASLKSGTLVTGSDYVAFYAGTIDDPTKPIGALGASMGAGWVGITDYRFIMDTTAGVTQNSHIFKLPPGHTLRREMKHFGAGDLDTNIRVWGEKNIVGPFWLKAGESMDGDLYRYTQFVLPT